jgi:hypothetical protein
MHALLVRRSAAVRSLAVVAAIAATAALAACGSTSSGTTVAASAPAASTTAPAVSETAATGVSLEDAWIKTGSTGAMTAVFGTLTNPGTTEVVVKGGMSDVAKMVELHEVVMADGEMKMQPKAGGFTIPAGGTHLLEPGHDHIMVMGLTKDVKAGDMVTVELTLSDGSKVTVQAVGKDFTGANETYAPSASMSSGM